MSAVWRRHRFSDQARLRRLLFPVRAHVDMATTGAAPTSGRKAAADGGVSQSLLAGFLPWFPAGASDAASVHARQFKRG
jgi:hypothetical protein